MMTTLVEKDIKSTATIGIQPSVKFSYTSTGRQASNLCRFRVALFSSFPDAITLWPMTST